MNSTRIRWTQPLILSLGLLLGACLSEGPPPDDDDVSADDDDAGSDDDDAGSDDDDASAAAPLRTQAALSAGGGSTSSDAHQARIVVGPPQPGRASSENYELTVGAAAR